MRGASSWKRWRLAWRDCILINNRGINWRYSLNCSNVMSNVKRHHPNEIPLYAKYSATAILAKIRHRLVNAHRFHGQLALMASK